MTEKVAELDVKGCFMQKKPEFYVPTVTAAHELVRQAARLADEARELEKAGDSLLRTPHAKDGAVLEKRSLVDKPK
jgi:methylenetetrahydromethanopterin dehydrogenase